MSETVTPDTQSAESIAAASPTSPSPADIPRYLLQYLLASQGVCHEYTLLAALMQLARDLGLVPEGGSPDATHWHGQLREHIETANVRLEPLQFHVAQVQLGSGKRAAMAQWRREIAGAQLSPADTEALSHLPDSSRYYVHVNTQSSPETRTGTWMTPQQVEFAKWCVAQFAEHGTAVQTLSPEVAAATAALRADIDRATGAGGEGGWRRCVSYSVGSTQLAQYPGLSAIETEQAVAQLCERRWLARTSDGRVGLAVRAAAELDSLLRDTYALPRCAVCARVVLHGAACGNLAAHVSEGPESGEEDEDEASSGMTMWHVDCYQHYVAHVSKSCPKCSASIVDDAVYVL